MSRGFAIFTLGLQVLGHATNMALRHDSSLMWFFIHLAVLLVTEHFIVGDAR